MSFSPQSALSRKSTTRTTQTETHFGPLAMWVRKTGGPFTDRSADSTYSVDRRRRRQGLRRATDHVPGGSPPEKDGQLEGKEGFRDRARGKGVKK